MGSEQRRVLWRCSYQNELLEHYRIVESHHPYKPGGIAQWLIPRCPVPSDVPSDIHPHTLHSRHRPYYNASDMERHLTFQEPHRIRYTNDEGVCIHDQYIKVRYEFTTIDSSIQFQGDLRRKDLVAFYDVDVVWTNLHGRTDSYGKVKGIGAIQRLKLWRDRYSTFHSLSILANKTDGLYREYEVHNFEGELRERDDRAKRVRLVVHGRRHSATDEQQNQRRFALGLTQLRRPRRRTGSSSSEGGSSVIQPQGLDIRYLGIQFTDRQGKITAKQSRHGISQASLVVTT